MRTHKNRDKQLIEKLENQYSTDNDGLLSVDDFTAYNSHLKNFKEQMKVKKYQHKEHKPNSRVSKLIHSLEAPRGLKIEGFHHSKIDPTPEEIIKVREELKPAPEANEKKIRNRLKNFFRFNDFSNRRIKDSRYVDPLYYQFDLKNMTIEKESDIVMGAESELLENQPLLGIKSFSEEFLERRKQRKETKNKATEEEKTDEIPFTDEEDIFGGKFDEDDEDTIKALAKFRGEIIPVKSAKDIIQGEPKIPEKELKQEKRMKSLEEIKAEGLKLLKDMKTRTKKLEVEGKEPEKQELDEVDDPIELENAEKQTTAAVKRKKELREIRTKLSELEKAKISYETNTEMPESGKLTMLNDIDEEIRNLKQVLHLGDLTIIEAFDKLKENLEERHLRTTINKTKKLPAILLANLNSLLILSGLTQFTHITNEQAFYVITGQIPVEYTDYKGDKKRVYLNTSIDKKRPKEKTNDEPTPFGARGVMTLDDLEPSSPLRNSLPYINKKPSDIVLGNKKKE